MKKKMTFIIVVVLVIIIAVYMGINKSQHKGSANKTDKAVSTSKNHNVNKNTRENNKKVATAVNKAQGETTKAQDGTVKDDALNVSVGSMSGSVSDNGEIPINFENATKNGINACELLIKYDPSVIKIGEINPGKIVEDPKVNFFTKNDEKIGEMKIFYMPSTKQGKDITKKGDFAKIKFQIKQGAKKGVSPIELVQTSVFCDKAMNKYKASIKNGNITVK